MPATRPQMKEGRPWNRALLIAARSRQLDWSRFFHHRVRRRQATPASSIDAGGLGKTVRDDEGFRSTPALPKNSSATACMASSRLGEFKTWRVQDLARPACTARIGLSLTLGALRGGLAFRTAAPGIELFVKRKRPRRGLLTFTPRLLRP
jgi:hypothetical protein